MCNAVGEGGIDVFAGEQAVEQPRRERIAPAHSIEDLDAVHPWAAVKAGSGVADGAPVVDGGGADLPEGGRDDPTIDSWG